MSIVRSLVVSGCSLVAAVAFPLAATGQEPAAASQDPHAAHAAGASPSPWMWMTDGAIFVNFNVQASERGERQIRSQNWFMVMGSRAVGKGRLTLNGMVSAEPLTVTPRGYSQLFQHGEAYEGLENIDRQHPHDLFSQIAAVWQVPIGKYRVSVAGGPVGEATLGPVVFMHRASAAENPTSPLGHHTLDSTHVVQGVLAAGVDRGPMSVEASWFHGREPDQYRADLKVGALDSWAARVWYRPTAAFSAQVSHGFLNDPEELVPGDVRRTTASVSWQHDIGASDLAVSAMVGQNRESYDLNLTAFLAEATWRRSRLFLYTRLEDLQVATEHLLFPTVVHKPHPKELVDVVGAYTAGGGVELAKVFGFELAAGGDLVFNRVPNRLVSFYGDHPVSGHVFLRIRTPAGHMGRMTEMTMIPR